MSNNHLEHKFQCAAIGLLKIASNLNPGRIIYCGMPDLGKLTIPQKKRFKARGYRAGWPDIVLLIDGSFIGVELKVKYSNGSKNKQSDDQVKFEKDCLNMGAPYYVAYDIDEFCVILRDLGLRGV